MGQLQRLRKESFLSAHGGKIILLIFAFCVWILIDGDVHRQPDFRYLFPVTWLELFGMGQLVSPFTVESWWMYVEIVVTVLAWTMIFILVRASIYKYASFENPSLYFSFSLFIVGAVVFIFLGMRPIFDDIARWWQAWPGRTPVHSGEWDPAIGDPYGR